MIFEDKIRELNIVLPEAKAPVGSYLATKISNNLLFISGQISMNSKGELINYTLLKSSGNKSLDNVAVEILEMASPFLPFDASMKEFSEITIVRDWNFGLPKT